VPASINILNATPLSLRELEHIVKSVQSIFELPVFARNERLDLEQAYDPTRRQFNSTVLLAQTLLKPNPNKNKLIPIVNVDLYVPILTYVFGEAQLNGTAAIVSMHRLSNVYYGIPNDHKLMLTRLEKEIVHELGHTFGLIHCHQFECVMRSSTYVEEIDFKKVTPCTACTVILKAKINQLPNLQSPEQKEDFGM
jgi:archaemetzincin